MVSPAVNNVIAKLPKKKQHARKNTTKPNKKAYVVGSVLELVIFIIAKALHEARCQNDGMLVSHGRILPTKNRE